MGLVARSKGSSRGSGRSVTASARCCVRRGHRRLRTASTARPDGRRHAGRVVLGKIIGGGLPIGAFGASDRDHVGDRTARTGVPGGDPVGESAGHRGRLGGAIPARPGGLGQLTASPSVWPAGCGLPSRSGRAGDRCPGSVRSSGCFFGDRERSEGTDRSTSERGASVALRYPSFFHGMLERGVAFAPGPWEVCSRRWRKRRGSAGHDRGGPRGGDALAGTPGGPPVRVLRGGRARRVA